MNIQNNKNWRVRKSPEDIWCVNTKVYLQEVVKMLDTQKQVGIPVSGNSMSPFLCAGRDFVLLENTKYHAIKKGDIVLYLRPTGQFVLHRVWSVQKDTYKMVGDAQSYIEGPIAKEQVKAVVVRIKRKGKWLKKWSFHNLFFRWIWIRIVPVRANFLQIYAYLKYYIIKN